MKRNLTFILLCKDPGDTREITRALSSYPGASLLMTTDDSEQAIIETARLRPSALVINFALLGDLGLKLVQRIVAESPRTAVICASRDASPDLILRSLRVGARDFIRLPILDDELSTVMERTTEFSAGQVESEVKKRGRAIAVFSSKAGSMRSRRHTTSRSSRSGTTSAITGNATRACVSITYCCPRS